MLDCLFVQFYLIILFGSTPQLAAIMTFGSACSILVQSSLAAKPTSHCFYLINQKNKFAFKPPKTTECTAPNRTVANIAMIVSGISGI